MYWNAAQGRLRIGLVHQKLEQEIAGLHEACAEALLRFASTFTSDEQLSLDAVQEAFVRYFVERRFGREIANPRAWLYTVVRNYMLDHKKSSAARQEVPMQEAEQVEGRQRDPERLAARRETAREIEAALSRRELECLRLRSEGFSYEEIAQRMTITPGTVGALLTRVHSKLRGMGRGGSWTLSATRDALRFLVMEVSPEAS